MNPAYIRWSTSALSTFCHSGVNFLGFYFVKHASSKIFRLCCVTLKSIPGMSLGEQVKTSTFFFRKLTN
ncbi:hypothetical protein B296_00021008 [Ensete ventricosum]|uniref:Uncharacterized protein n=1 Tax=Ensete ventricosum TaxID=4639 RepID=A0A426Y3R9_ENSVE|nr:hypothetical protein B296_00021008 [Ensete ventricosum]